jgi:hypothetical protein
MVKLHFFLFLPFFYSSICQFLFFLSLVLNSFNFNFLSFMKKKLIVFEVFFLKLFDFQLSTLLRRKDGCDELMIKKNILTLIRFLNQSLQK